MTSSIQQRLIAIGEELPQTIAPVANYVPYTVTGNLISVSGQIPIINGENKYVGKIGQDVDVSTGALAAKACALNILAHLDKAVEGQIERVKQCVKLGGFINATDDFTDHSIVMNGASDLIVDVLGDAGKHSRFAVGVASLPLGVAVEVDAIFEIV